MSVDDKPSYLPEIVETIPKIQETQRKTVTRKQPSVHSTEFIVHFVEKEGFYVVATEDGTIITDMELLKKLRALRLDIAKEQNVRAYHIMKNETLVSVATYRPTTKEQFVAIKGLGEARYASFGERFIEVIKKHEESH
ncbi:MAG: HRDC domain-containing protein [Clostridia bacterium]|nr:HRDC domain-containing protein [Clostridia bacterium]